MYKDIPLFLIDFLGYLKTIKGLSDKTIMEYYYDLRLFLKFVEYRQNPFVYDQNKIDTIDIHNFDVKRLNDLSIIDCHSYISFRDTIKDNGSTTRARKISSLRSLYKYLTNVSKIIEKNPTLELQLPKVKKRNPIYLTLDEAKHLLSVVNTNKNEFLKRRDFAIILMFLTTGIRLSELSSINVNFLKDTKFSVVGKGDKERTVYMTMACKYALDDYLEIRPKIQDESALFLSTRKKRMSNRAIQHMIEKYLNIAGFDTSVYSTHKLRHTAATLMYKEGVDIRTLQKILGHATVATTQIYTHVEDEDVKNAIEHNPLSKI